MSTRTKAARRKLKAHDAGRNRHNKGVAYEDKQARLDMEHRRQRSRSKRLGG